MRVLAVGEVLWDVVDDVERLGGAPLNVAVHAARFGHEAAIVSAVGADRRGNAAIEAIERLGVSTRFVATVPDAPTGVATVTLDADGSPAFAIERPAAFDLVPTTASLVGDAAAWDPDWLVLGTLAQSSPTVRDLTVRLIDAAPRAATLYDLNLRPGAADMDLVSRLLDAATVAKLSESEARFVAGDGVSARAGETFASRLAERHDLRAVCITRGPDGLALWLDGVFVEAASYPVAVADTIGAGDAVAAALIHGIGAGWTAGRVAELAARVGALVASRDGAIPAWTLDEALALGRTTP